MPTGNEVMPPKIEENNTRNSKYFSMHFSMKKLQTTIKWIYTTWTVQIYMKIAASEEKSTHSNITQVRWPLEMWVNNNKYLVRSAPPHIRQFNFPTLLTFFNITKKSSETRRNYIVNVFICVGMNMQEYFTESVYVWVLVFIRVRTF